MRRISHGQENEPILEYLLREWRFYKAEKFITSRSRVADLGCGYEGKFLHRISKKIREGVGYDVSFKHVKLPSNIVFRKANLNKRLNNGGELFDCVTALAVLEHVNKPEEFIKNVKAILKSEGLLILTTPHKRGKKVLEFLSKSTKLISKYEIDDHKNYFDEKSVRKLFTICGMKTNIITTFEFGQNILAIAQKSSSRRKTFG